MSNKRWLDNSIQFPRLIAEIVATQENLDVDALCSSMDISLDELNELFDRADKEFEKLKESL